VSEPPARPSSDVKARAGLRRHVLGLRPRMLAALLLSSAVTLAVAALALLSPLEQRLRSEGESGVYAAISSSRSEFEEIGVDPTSGRPDAGELAITVSLLRHRSGAEVTVLGDKLNTIYAPADQDLDVPDYYSQARRALRSGRGVHTLIGDDLVAVEPIQIGKGGTIDAVVLVRRLEYVISTVKVVKKAFLEAAAVGLGIALLLGIALTTTLLRRLERLREAAGELERRGLDAPIRLDTRPDEIGDLTRAFASMQVRLRRQIQARHAFVATASHELRTPLASLDGTLELLEDDLDPQRLDLVDARERTLRAREQSHRLTSLATDLLDLSRIDAEISLRTEPVELGELCRAVAAEFERRAAEHELQLEVHQPPRPCWAMCDPGAVARIVRILLDNAIGIAPPGTRVDARATTEGQWAQVRVRDSGPGVPAAERERIFERFQRGSASAGSSGFGLGLAIGRELVTRMGGTLTLADGQPAQTDGVIEPETALELSGACFVMCLPAAHVSEHDAT
jgi:signal transduction histidine kinase